MASSRRERRFLTSVAATVAAVALVAGCGGSTVEPSAQGSDATDQQATTDTNSGAAVTAPGAVAGTAASAGSADAPAAAAPGAAASAAQPPDVAKPGKSTKQGSNITAAGGGSVTSVGGSATSAVESMVTNSAIFGGKAPCKPATLSEIPIGNVSTLSGVLGEEFAPASQALAVFVASQNACGGLNGHRIKFYQDDDQGDPATAASKVQSMIQTKKILAFVGNIQILTVDAIVPVIKRLGVPVIGSDLTNNTWFTNPLFFPQGSPPQSISYGYVQGASQYFKVKNVGHVWCIEVPRACEQINRAYVELAPQFGVTNKRSIQVSITAPSYVQQCLDLKNAGVEAVALSTDGPTMVRLARSCEQVGFHPHVLPYPLGLGNEKQYFGAKWLGNAYVPMNHFPWMGNNTPAEKYWQASIKKFNPGMENGGAASLAWGSGALLVAASAGLSPTNPTTEQLLDTLWLFKGQKFTTLGGLAAPLTFQKDGNPRVPYCLFGAVSNDDNNGWKEVVSKPVCTDVTAPSDPQHAR